MPDITLEHLVVFHGELSPQQAHVYVRLDGGDSLSSWRLQGRITGPHNALTRTLPATVALQDLGPGPSKLARAIVPDPCYWLPGEPYQYDVHVQLVGPQGIVAATERTIGLRAFGTCDRQLLLEAQRWQLCGAAEESVETAAWPAWRETGMTKFLRSPSHLQCQQASAEGVMLIAHVEAATAAGIEREIRRLSRHAAVAIISLSAAGLAADTIRVLAPNVLLAQSHASLAPLVPAAWADLVICPVADRRGVTDPWPHRSLPVLLHCPRDQRTSLAEARDICQQLLNRAGPLEALAGCLI